MSEEVYASSSSQKRSLSPSDDLPPQPKKVKTLALFDSSLTLAALVTLSSSKLDDLPKEVLKSYILQLQEGMKASKAEIVSLKKSPPPNASSSQAETVLAPEVVEAKVRALAKLMESGITKQMKWLPTCKTGRSKWSYTSMVPNAAVLHKLFSLPIEKKVWKQKKIPRFDLYMITGEINARIRYGYLQITSSEITLKYDREASTFTVSGTYGL